MVLAGLVLAPAWPGDCTGAAAPSPLVTTNAGPVRWEHRYRVSGKVWLLFWVSRDDVGTARLTRRMSSNSSTVSFIGGSDPRRAPGNLNQWGAAIEDVRGEEAKVFVVRSIAPDDVTAPERQLVERSDDALFGAACTSVERTSSHSSVTGVRADPGMTVRSMAVFLDLLGRSGQWTSTRTERPADTYPGFFTAILSGIDESVARARQGILAPAVSHRLYIFKGGLYDIRFRKIEPAGPGLLREKFTYRNRTTGDSADFTVTFGTEGALAGVPVEMAFQPSWWVRVQLRLDDSADVPGDPFQDAALASRIDAICSRALGRGANVTQ